MHKIKCSLTKKVQPQKVTKLMKCKISDYNFIDVTKNFIWVLLNHHQIYRNFIKVQHFLNKTKLKILKCNCTKYKGQVHKIKVQLHQKKYRCDMYKFFKWLRLDRSEWNSISQTGTSQKWHIFHASDKHKVVETWKISATCILANPN